MSVVSADAAAYYGAGNDDENENEDADVGADVGADVAGAGAGAGVVEVNYDEVDVDDDAVHAVHVAAVHAGGFDVVDVDVGAVHEVKVVDVGVDVDVHVVHADVGYVVDGGFDEKNGRAQGDVSNLGGLVYTHLVQITLQA